ncbi:hypothetical protein MKEN_00636700 [Mycena kentingensis (nom. inval.)]|nr:hypothetical protein MKEN_00636700 [Mycena kentingensis (nom. inval.)]
MLAHAVLSILTVPTLRGLALTLTLPAETFTAGQNATVQWTRDDPADPQSFGIMQRNLQGDGEIMDVTPVENVDGADSGSVQVFFGNGTSGQVLLSPISQLSLSSGETPNQLAAGRQLTILASTADSAIAASPSSSDSASDVGTTTRFPKAEAPTTIESAIQSSSATNNIATGADAEETTVVAPISGSTSARIPPSSSSSRVPSTELDTTADLETETETPTTSSPDSSSTPPPLSTRSTTASPRPTLRTTSLSIPTTARTQAAIVSITSTTALLPTAIAAAPAADTDTPSSSNSRFYDWWGHPIGGSLSSGSVASSAGVGGRRHRGTIASFGFGYGGATGTRQQQAQTQTTATSASAYSDDVGADVEAGPGYDAYAQLQPEMQQYAPAPVLIPVPVPVHREPVKQTWALPGASVQAQNAYGYAQNADAYYGGDGYQPQQNNAGLGAGPRAW